MSVDKADLGKLVAVRNGIGELVAVGYMCGYTDMPTAVIETIDGRQIHWVADMCYVRNLTESEVQMLFKKGESSQ
jgi:hypothetical protein